MEQEIKDLATLDEAGLRDAQVPWPKTEKELSDLIATLANRGHDYGTCVYAMSIAAVAAYNFMAHKLGVTGFQAGCADLDILRRNKRWERFMLINFDDALYPQYDLHGKLDEGLKNCRPWLIEKAKERLREDSEHAHIDVIAHWQKLAKMEPVK